MPQFTLQSPVGLLTLTEENGAIVSLVFGGTAETPPPTPLLREAQRQLNAYFSAELQNFDLPLSPYGTPFQQSVWQQLRAVPYGQTRTYAEIAAAVGKPNACRAVGMASHRNPIAIVIPCHRVIGSDGSLTGYAGGLERKQTLLRLEQQK